MARSQSAPAYDLTDEMDSAVPRKSAVHPRVAVEGISSRSRIGHGTPQMNGTAMPNSGRRDHRPRVCGHQCEVESHDGEPRRGRLRSCEKASICSARRRPGKTIVEIAARRRRSTAPASTPRVAEDRRLASGTALAISRPHKQQQDQLGREDRRRVFSCHACLRCGNRFSHIGVGSAAHARMEGWPESC